MYDGDLMFINVSVPEYYNVTSVIVDMNGTATLDLSLVDNSSILHLWQAVWVVHNASVGEHFATIRAFDAASNLYSAQVEWRVLSEEEELGAFGNESSDINVADDSMVSQTFVDGNVTQNQTGVYPRLNITLSSVKSVYFVNETVVIQGNVLYNGSFVNTSPNFLIEGPSYNSSVVLNATDGMFSYEFVPSNIGNYSVQAVVFYENESAEGHLMFYVQSMPLNVTNMSSVNITVFEAKGMIDSGENITVLDVRSSEEYSSGYIDDAISFPLIDFSCESCLHRMLEEHKEGNIIVYSESGIRGKQVCDILLENGFTAVYNIEGGITAWKDTGFSINVPTDEESVYSQIDQSLRDGIPVFMFFLIYLCYNLHKCLSVIQKI